MLFRLILLIAAIAASPALGQDRATVSRAFDGAIAIFDAALPGLATSETGVDVAAYHDALRLQPFSSAHWGGPIRLETEIRAEPTGSCGRFAAFVRIPPENGTVRLVFCPQFFAEGTDGLWALTVLHEMVHVVAGPDECRAMAFAARVEQAARGSFTPVDRYWRASGCDASAYRLP